MTERSRHKHEGTRFWKQMCPNRRYMFASYFILFPLSCPESIPESIQLIFHISLDPISSYIVLCLWIPHFCYCLSPLLYTQPLTQASSPLRQIQRTDLSSKVCGGGGRGVGEECWSKPVLWISHKSFFGSVSPSCSLKQLGKMASCCPNTAQCLVAGPVTPSAKSGRRRACVQGV